jgi:predicted ribosomally synthesized peptide with SipW-like signal peptide
MPRTQTTDADRNRRLRRRGLILLLLSLSVASLGAGAFSLAIFTDSDASTGTFTAGTIDIATNPTTLFTVAAIMPGDSGSATLTVNNGGTGQLRYAMTSASTNTDTKALRDQLALTVRPGACPSAAATIFNGVLSAAAFGSTAQGAQAGDRTLNAAASEQLCFGWSFPLASGNTFQGATTTTTFTFTAEQTANNP